MIRCREIPQRLFHALWAFICPPIYLDWEAIYRDTACSLPVRSCWRRSMTCFAAFNLMHSIETVLFGLPTFLLVRTFEMDPALSESVWQVRLFLNLTIANTFVTPLVMGGLAYLYFVYKGHPWARILRRELGAKDESLQQVDHEPVENTRRWTI